MDKYYTEIESLLKEYESYINSPYITESVSDKIKTIISNISRKIVALIRQTNINLTEICKKPATIRRLNEINEMLMNCPSIGNKVYNDELRGQMTINDANKEICNIINNYSKKLSNAAKKAKEDLNKITCTLSPEDYEKYKEVFEVYDRVYALTYETSTLRLLYIMGMIENIMFIPHKVHKMAKQLIANVYHVSKEDKSDIDDIQIKWKKNMIDSITVNGIPVALYTVPNGYAVTGSTKAYGKKILIDASPGIAATYPNAGGYAIIMMDRAIYKMYSKEVIVAILYHEIGHMQTQMDGGALGSWVKKSNLYHDKTIYKERAVYMKDLNKAFDLAVLKYGDKYCSHLDIDELEADYRSCRNGNYKDLLTALSLMYKGEKDKRQLTERNIRIFVVKYMHQKGYF